jgi:hypothetical protein
MGAKARNNNPALKAKLDPQFQRYLHIIKNSKKNRRERGGRRGKKRK